MSSILKALQGVLNTAAAASAAAAVAQDNLFRKFTYESMRWTNTAAVTTTVAVTEISVGIIKMPQRLVEAKFTPTSGAVTAGATHYFSLLVAARNSAGESRNLVTFAADTTTTDDAAQWIAKDLETYFSATTANLDVTTGETITAAVSKTGTNGMTFPAGTLELRFRPRDT